MFDEDNEPPPVFRTWKQFYIFIAGWLVVLIAAFYLFTKYFS
jgi:hypothetical protein